MAFLRPIFGRGAGLAIGLGLVALVACGGQEPPAGQVDTGPEATQPAGVPTAAPELTATSEPAVSAPEPAKAPTPVATREPTEVPTATAVPTPQPAPVSAMTTFDQYGFTLKIDRETEIKAAGWSQAEAGEQQGVLSFPYGGVTVLLRWVPSEGLTPADMLADSFNVLKSSQANVQFEAVRQGDVTVADQPGVFGGFTAADVSGKVIGGGLIGAWSCSAKNTVFSLTVTGQELTTSQIRFQGLLNDFQCSS